MKHANRLGVKYVVMVADDEFKSNSAVVKDMVGSTQQTLEFDAVVRIDTPQEALYYANGGILQYVLRQLLASKPQTVGA